MSQRVTESPSHSGSPDSAPLKLKLVLVFGGSIAVLIAGTLLSLMTEARAEGENSSVYSVSAPAEPGAPSQLP